MTRAAKALAVLLAAGWLGDAPARAAFPGENGKIAFATSREGDYEIFVMNPDGAGQVNITNLEGNDVAPAWSPSGKIAFANNGRIYVAPEDGSNPVPVTSGGRDGNPTWSPDGTRIAFDRFALEDPRTSIMVVESDGGDVAPVVDAGEAGGGDIGQPAWSPDGQDIAFIREEAENDEDSEILVVRDAFLPTRSIAKLTVNEDQDLFPNWSPDGSKIVFARSDPRGGDRDIWVMNADGTDAAPLTSGNPDQDSEPAWSPDGQKITFMRSHAGAGAEVFVMNANGTGQQNLTNNSADDRSPDWQPSVDRDGDGLRDSWEEDGIDIDDDGTVDADLPAMGADPDHKDIFIEIDSMAGHALSQVALDRMATVFGAAPVANPDLVPGIVLHIDNGPGSTMNPLTGDTWGALSEADTLPHQPVIGFFDGNNRYDWSAFDATKQGNLSEGREPAFHYAISGHAYGAATERSSGISRNPRGLAFAQGASDLLVTLGPASEPAEGSGTVEEQAGTVMHELGHNLGLRHGGLDHTNYKPNYLSIMNYAFQFTGLPRADGSFELDYSRLSMLPLDEAALDEDNGLGFAPGSAQAQYKTAVLCPGPRIPPPRSVFTVPIVAGPHNWNCDMAVGGLVAADITGDLVLTPLEPFLDWPALVYDGGSIGDAGAGTPLPDTSDVIEPQLEELLLAKEALEQDIQKPAPQPGGTGPTPPGGPGGAGQVTVLERLVLGARGVTVGRGGRVRLRLRNPNAVDLDGKLTLDMRAPSQRAHGGAARRVVLASRRFQIAAGGRTVVKLRLRPAHRRLLARRKRLPARARISVKAPDGTKQTASRRLTLRAPRVRR